jgi:hypothetical protein
MSTDTDEKKQSRAANPFSQWLNGLSGLGQGLGGDLYRQIYKDWEQWFGAQFDKLARSDAFLEQVGKTLEGTLFARTAMNRWLEQSIKAMRLPTLGDLESIHKRLDEIERRLDALADKKPAAPKAAKRPTPREDVPQE